jgi:opine dehydrogenase
MSKNITVLGFGGTALVTAASLTLQGHQVTLAFPEKYAKPTFAAIAENGGILLRGGGATGLVKPAKVTTDLKAALAQAELIIVSTIANHHEELAAAIAAEVRDEQTILIAPGNAGALTFYHTFKRLGAKGKPVIAENSGNLTSARITGKAEVLSPRPVGSRKIAAFPAKDTPKAIAALKGVFEPEPFKHVFETTLNSPNVVNHLVSSILNTSKIDDKGKEFRLFIDGLTPSVFKGLAVAAEEWQSVLKALGYQANPSPVPHLLEVTQPDKFPQHAIFRSLDGPDSLSHRYVDEDAGAAVTLLVSLAHLVKVPVPLTEALINIASALNDKDYYGTGRNLENLGLGGKSPAEIHRILEEGF